MNNLSQYFRYFFCAVFMLLSSGCAPLLIGSGVTTGLVANDTRTTGTFIEDEVLENKILHTIANEYGSTVHVVVVSYNRNVLLLGQAPTQELYKAIENIATKQENIKKVYNRIELAAPSSLTSRLADTTLTGRVKVALCSLQIENFSCLNIKIVTENSNVYLLGLVDEKTANITVNRAREVSGVQKVVKVFEYI